MTDATSEDDVFKYSQSLSYLNTTSDVIIIDSDIDRRTRQEGKYGKKGLQPKCSIKSDEVS